MDPEVIGDVLAVAAAFDNRTVGDADCTAWYRVIGHLDQREAEEAIIAHYSETTDRIMPAHVLNRVGKLRALRIAHAGPEAVPDVDDPDDWRAYQAALREGRFRTASGMSPRPVRRAISGAFQRVGYQRVESKWNRNAIVPPKPALAIEPRRLPDDPDHALAVAILEQLSDAHLWLSRAAVDLEAEGVALTKPAVAIRAADMATRQPDADEAETAPQNINPSAFPSN